MVRKRIIKVISFVFAIWYLLCVVGFGVHTCGHSGKSFVSSLVLGYTFGNDLCSDMKCHEAGCSHHGDMSHDGFDEACADDVFVLSLPGVERSEDEYHSHSHCSCICGHCPALADSRLSVAIYSPEAMDIPVPDLSFKESVFSDIFSAYSIWRI